MYVFVIKGGAKIGDIVLGERDGLGVWDTDGFDIAAIGDSQILLMDVPMDVDGATNQL